MRFYYREAGVLTFRAGLRAQNSLEGVVFDSQSYLVIMLQDSQHASQINLPIRSQCINCRYDWVIYSRFRNEM